MRPRSKEVLPPLKCQPTAPPRESFWMHFLLWANGGTNLFSLTISESLCHALSCTTQTCAARYESPLVCLRDAPSQARSRTSEISTSPHHILFSFIYFILPPTSPDVLHSFLSSLTVFAISSQPISRRAKLCVQIEPCLIFPWPFTAWLPRIWLWSRHNARSCSECAHSGWSAREVQSARCDRWGAFVTDERGNICWRSQSDIFLNVKTGVNIHEP